MAKTSKHKNTKIQRSLKCPGSDVDTNFFTWGVIYLCKDQRFQCHTLESAGGRNEQGLLDLMQERVLNLTEEKRLTAVKVQFSPATPKQRVYIFCTIRSGESTEVLMML